MHRTATALLAAFVSLAFAMMPVVGRAAAPGTGATDAAAGTPAQPANKFKVKKLGRADVDALLATPDSVLFIDVRRPDEVEKIGGFPVYLSIQAQDLEKRLAFIPHDRTIVTVSNHAARAGVAGDLLESKGFRVAGAVGVENYRDEGGTITRIEVPAPKAASSAK